LFEQSHDYQDNSPMEDLKDVVNGWWLSFNI
jgi:hypothetical protein